MATAPAQTGVVHLICHSPGEVVYITDHTNNNSGHEARQHSMTGTLWIDLTGKTLCGM